MHLIRRIIASGVLAFALLAAQAAPVLAIPQVLLDMRTGEVLYQNEAGVPWHPASLTKLMTALLAFEAIETGQASLSTPVITSEHALSAPPSKMGFPVDTAITLEDALYILIVKSANDIAIAIAETIGGSEQAFVGMMNQRAAQLGLTGTHFVNPHGLHDPAQVTTARDMAVLALTIRARFPQYDPIFGTLTVEHGRSRLKSNNNLLSHFAGTDGMKTGYVCSSGLNIVATAERNGRNLMAVTLGATSSRERGEMTARMLNSGFAGGYRGLGHTIVQLTNATGIQPRDMRPDICGADAAEYREEREELFPAGLEGQVSYLNEDPITGPVHRITVIGQLRDVPLPRPRPSWLPADPAVAQREPSATPAAAFSGFGDSSLVTLDALIENTNEIIPLPRPRP